MVLTFGTNLLKPKLFLKKISKSFMHCINLKFPTVIDTINRVFQVFLSYNKHA